MILDEMSARSGSSDKTPKIKGLVKRCRSFKEDIISRLARNRSLAKEDGSRILPSGWNSGGTSPVPSDPEITDPILLIARRLKEAYLTLQFVESLIQKDCVDLLGGSSNVMLDLMGHLLNDVKGLTALSHTSAYQSTVSQLKSALGDFLTSIDALLLKQSCDPSQKEVYFEKVLETLKSTREALARLKALVDSRDGANHHHYSNSVRHQHQHHAPGHSGQAQGQDKGQGQPPGPLLTSTPLPPAGKLPSPTSKSDGSSPFPLSPSSGRSSPSFQERRPPLPPKLKQWTAKSFDSEYLPGSSSGRVPSPGGSPRRGQRSTQGQQHSSHPLAQLVTSSSSNLSPHHQSLLSQWLETSSSSSAQAQAQSHHQRSLSQHSRVRGQFPGQGHRLHSAASASRFETDHSNSSSNSNWTESAIYVARSTCSSSSRKGVRTFSDSYQLEDSQESLDLERLDFRSRSNHSASISLGSSLDNLLLVDSPSTSGLSPKAGSGSGGNRTSVSSSGKGLQLLPGGTQIDPDEDSVFTTSSENIGEAPPIPEKQDRRHFLLERASASRNGNGGGGSSSSYGYNGDRCPSPYENVDETDFATWHGVDNNGQNAGNGNVTFMSYSESRNTLTGGEDRPPLPPKKKHSLIAAYVEFLHNFETYHQQNQHHTHFQNHLNQIHQQVQQGGGDADSQRRQFRTERSQTLHNPGSAFQLHSSFQQFSFSSTVFAEEKEQGSQPSSPSYLSSGNGGYFRSAQGQGQGQLSPIEGQGHSQPPALPPKRSKHLGLDRKSTEDIKKLSLSTNNNHSDPETSPKASPSEPPCEPPAATTVVITPVHAGSKQSSMESPQRSLDEGIDLFLPDAAAHLTPNESCGSSNVSRASASSSSEGPEIKGGEPHLLLVYAASPDLKDARFREVFLLTYRTFLRPMDVIHLLWRRYLYFAKKASDRPSQVHARATLDLYADLVASLTPMDLEEEMVSKLRDCIYHLVSCGEIQSALKARKGLIHKYSIRQKLLTPKPPPVSLAVTAESQSLLQFSATSIAQQMTLLDAELFRQLEPAELLLWAREQSEDLCPALNNFTEHFNKVSYWARSRVLLCSNSRERNRTMKKMIEVMRKLREYNNFNSLLAVLAALDSAPIRRLGFSRRLTEALKPHAALTDSSGSFRTYRQALAESKPPCIPYIGLVLQDLTFVHIGNADLLPDGKVNWIKRWQQWVVLEPVRRFHACNYGFVRNDPLLVFLNHFDESLNDDELWQLSESIKPRSKN